MTAIEPGQASAGLAMKRWHSLAVGAILFLAIVIQSAGVFSVDLLLQGAADGAVLGLWIVAALGIGQLALSKLRFVTRDEAALATVTAVAVGLGVMSLITLGLGLGGLLNRATAWGVVGAGVVLALYGWRERNLKDVKAWLSARSKGAVVSWSFAIPLAVAFVAASIFPGQLWKPLDPHPYDVLSYHLQIPREWYDAGRILPLRHNSFSFFPMGMEMHYLTAMHLMGGPWVGMYLCQFMSLAHGVLTVVAVIAVCRTMAAGPVVARLAGLMTACVPWVLMLSSVCYVESGVMLYTLLAVAWAMRAIDAERRAPIQVMALAGALAGFACGMKYTAVAMTAAPVLIFWPIVAWRGRGLKGVAVPWLAASVACGLVFSPWLIRNAAWTGNPVFPLAAKVFGPGHFTPDQVDRYQIAHQPPPDERSISKRIGATIDRVIVDGEFGYLIVPMGVLAGVVLLSGRRFASPPTTLMIGVAGAMFGVWLLATHVMPRFLTPVIPLLAVLSVVAAVRLMRFGRLAAGLLFVGQAAVGLAWTWNTLAGTLPLARQGLFRLTDLTILETDETKAARTSGDKVALIGDAQAFYYAVPSDRLFYRGVFDVNVPPGLTTVDAWQGKSIDQLRREGYWVVVNTSELDRLTRTYAHLPRPVPPFDQVAPVPIVLPPVR